MGKKKQIERLRRHKNAELAQEMIRDIEERHRWTRNIQPPSTPRRYDPNEPPFDPNAFLSDFGDDEDL